MTLKEMMAQCEQTFLRQALQANDGRIGITSKALGISRKNLWEKCKRYGIRAEELFETVTKEVA